MVGDIYEVIKLTYINFIIVEIVCKHFKVNQVYARLDQHLQMTIVNDNDLVATLYFSS